MSFLTLGIFWSGQQVQLNHVARTDRSLTWLTFAFLFAVSIMPFSTRLLAGFMRIARRCSLLGQPPAARPGPALHDVGLRQPRGRC